MLFERQGGIEHRLDPLHPICFDRLLDLPCVARSVLDDMFADLLLAAAEQQIIAREVRVSEDMSRDENVFCKAIACREIGVSRIAWKHHFEES